jgi:predicted PurR-regulated permease PerM
LSLTAGLLTGLGQALSNVVVILLTVAFILLEASSFPIKLRSILGDPEQAFPQFTKFVTDIQRYMIIKTVINLIGGVLIGLWLYAIGVDFPVLWGFLFFLLHYIPNLGSTVAGIPPVLLALTQLGVGPAALTAAGCILIGVTLGNLVEPRLMGRKLGLSTLVVFLSLIFWGTMLGLVGALLCVPLTMTLKLACEESEEAMDRCIARPGDFRR